MAAKTNAVGLRKITKPVISTDVMGNRNVEVRAVGAWVQPACSIPSEGVVRSLSLLAHTLSWLSMLVHAQRQSYTESKFKKTE